MYTTSKATEQNWQRLGSAPVGNRLTSRANKTRSCQYIFPAESVENRQNTDWFDSVCRYILQQGVTAHTALYSLSINLLRGGVSNLDGLQAFERSFGQDGEDEMLAHCSLPQDESDILGVVYQMITPEGQRNLRGQYYTPGGVARAVLADSPVVESGYVLDPCCGSGSFLCAARVASPAQLLGVDIDPVAVMITWTNLMLRYPDKRFVPQVICGDFINLNLFSPVAEWLRGFGSEIVSICTNPPWGANRNNGQGETFSLFIRESMATLPAGGRLCLLLPDSFANIKAHSEIRKHLLSAAVLHKIEYLPPVFSGVVTSCLALSATKGMLPGNEVQVVRAGSAILARQDQFMASADAALVAHDGMTADIISLMHQKGAYTLEHSTWALGIVTGDNGNKVSTICKGAEWRPICTGKDITPYRLKPASRYVRYVRSELQQVAREEIYAAPEKLVYKFISKGLCFSYDDSGVLFLNSANILIPDVPGMGIKTVLGFLNSDLYKFIYEAMFNDVKVLKGNLMRLPFPALAEGEDAYVSACVDSIIRGQASKHDALQEFIYAKFGLSVRQVEHVRAKVYGNT